METTARWWPGDEDQIGDARNVDQEQAAGQERCNCIKITLKMIFSGWTWIWYEMKEIKCEMRDQALLKHFCETGISWIDHFDQDADHEICAVQTF